ncbi:unnamed protein product [Microthlaspi erraticum]|uniref:FBD domain-containing protein n=1 Tax=Microthlaspi erraticum TaxID=1685480 RepID=A0A6D2J129_9BRAS|nr:unnamed protein product [Microthlaspi erraticum]
MAASLEVNAKTFYDDSYQNIEYAKFSRFVDRSLILHEAPLDTLHFKLVQNSSAADIVTLPRSLYTRCTTLVTLKLKSVTLVDVSSLPSFPTLKTLWLVAVKYPGDEFVKRLLSNCHVLQDLLVALFPSDNVTVFTASFYVTYSQPGKIMSCITSVKCLTLCLSTSKEVYPVGTVFQNLVHLRVCTCETEWVNLLLCMLRGCPNLQSLKLFQCRKLPAPKPRPCLKGSTLVPGCLSSSLKALRWVDYEGREEEKQVADLILRTGSCLKKVTIFSKATDPNRKLEMLKELSSIPIAHLPLNVRSYSTEVVVKSSLRV